MRASTVVVLVAGLGVLGAAAAAWFFFFRTPARSDPDPPPPATVGPPWLGELMSGVGQSLPDIGRGLAGMSDFFQGLQSRQATG